MPGFEVACLERWTCFNVRLLLETKYRRLPVVDSDGKLVRNINPFLFLFDAHFFPNISHWLLFIDISTLKVGIITRGNVVRAALQIKRAVEGFWGKQTFASGLCICRNWLLLSLCHRRVQESPLIDMYNFGLRLYNSCKFFLSFKERYICSPSTPIVHR